MKDLHDHEIEVGDYVIYLGEGKGVSYGEILGEENGTVVIMPLKEKGLVYREDNAYILVEVEDII